MSKTKGKISKKNIEKFKEYFDKKRDNAKQRNKKPQ